MLSICFLLFVANQAFAQYYPPQQTTYQYTAGGGFGRPGGFGGGQPTTIFNGPGGFGPSNANSLLPPFLQGGQQGGIGYNPPYGQQSYYPQQQQYGQMPYYNQQYGQQQPYYPQYQQQYPQQQYPGGTQNYNDPNYQAYWRQVVNQQLFGSGYGGYNNYGSGYGSGYGSSGYGSGYYPTSGSYSGYRPYKSAKDTAEIAVDDTSAPKRK